MAEQANWYVAHTYSGYENKVATDLMTMVENRHLQDLICDVKVPTETRIEEVFDKRGNKTGEKEVQSKLYPGYIFYFFNFVKSTNLSNCFFYSFF
jgi:transcriptional antiterminator NusG